MAVMPSPLEKEIWKTATVDWRQETIPIYWVLGVSFWDRFTPFKSNQCFVWTISASRDLRVSTPPSCQSNQILNRAPIRFTICRLTGCTWLVIISSFYHDEAWLPMSGWYQISVNWGWFCSEWNRNIIDQRTVGSPTKRIWTHRSQWNAINVEPPLKEERGKKYMLLQHISFHQKEINI